MKPFIRIVLPVIMAATATVATAADAIPDHELSNVTGRDGLTLTITPPGPLSMSLVWHDKDGLTGAADQTYGSAGAVVLGAVPGQGTNALTLTSGASNINIIVTLDADGGAGGVEPTLNAGVKLPGILNIYTGDIWVAKSNAPSATQSGRGFTNALKILDNMSYQIEDFSVNLQMGSQPQGALIKLNGQITNGLKIDNFKLYDNGTTDAVKGGIGAQRILVTNTQPNEFGDPYFSFNVSASATPQGLTFSTDQLGDSGGLDVLATQVKLGDLSASGKAIGDVELAGVKLGNTLVSLTGH